MTNPLIMVAPNGARLNKLNHPKVPITIPEIVTTAQCCFGAGASALHLHIRDSNGAHSLDAGLYREAISELADEVPTMRVQITTEAAGVFSVSEQLACIKAVEPDWASISVREISRSPELASSIYSACAELGTEVQHILYDQDDASLLKDWQMSGTVQEHQNSVLLVLGRHSENQVSNPADIQSFFTSLPSSSRWMVCAFGSAEHECLNMAASLGGDCRVGFENSQVNEIGVPWANNTASVSALYTSLF